MTNICQTSIDHFLKLVKKIDLPIDYFHIQTAIDLPKDETCSVGNLNMGVLGISNGNQLHVISVFYAIGMSACYSFLKRKYK